MVRIARKN